MSDLDKMLQEMERLLKRYRRLLNISTPILVGIFVSLFFAAYMVYIIGLK
jgi:hypothetical protein